MVDVLLLLELCYVIVLLCYSCGVIFWGCWIWYYWFVLKYFYVFEGSCIFVIIFTYLCLFVSFKGIWIRVIVLFEWDFFLVKMKF